MKLKMGYAKYVLTGSLTSIIALRILHQHASFSQYFSAAFLTALACVGVAMISERQTRQSESQRSRSVPCTNTTLSNEEETMLRADVYKAKDGYRWRLWSSSDVVAISGQGYSSKDYCRKAVKKYTRADCVRDKEE